ncbi:MAG: DUF3160 domain-containing protein [Bryobacteraceae bacterium]
MRLPLLLTAVLPALGFGSVFDGPELQIAPSPSVPVQVRLAAGVRAIDSEVSPTGPLVALLVSNPSGSQEIRFWGINQEQPLKVFDVPAGFSARSLAWHPLGGALFLLGAQGQQYAIFKVEKTNGNWVAQRIYGSGHEIRRLVSGPRPYIVRYDDAGQRPVQAYRLFFGLKGNDGTFSIHSITEDGQREYQVVGHKESFTKFADAGQDPSQLTAVSALPAAFHPAGHLLLWEDERHCFHVASYDRDYWSKSAKLTGRDVCGGTMTVTPNGAGLLHWTQGSAGIELLLQQGTVRRREAAGYEMTATPSSVADGKGIAGITRAGAGFAVTYFPIDVPLADSINAWMYLESRQDAQLLTRNGGLFRDLKDQDQLYSLYDTESYYCGHPDESTPTRPYLVTTDSFWELFAAAYEGIFIVRERQTAIPAFRKFVEMASASLLRSNPQSPWTHVFADLAALQTKPETNEEAGRILSADGARFSPSLGQQFDYLELKPRGHYTATPEAQRYFRAFRYLTRVSALGWSTDELRQLPPDVKAAAMLWIGSYQDLIAPSRPPLVWQDAPAPLPYVKHPQTAPVLFPLSWGFDNEALFSTTYHSELPQDEQINGPGGSRLQPSSLDIAAALGSRLASDLLAGEIRRYPKLDAALADLAVRSANARAASSPNLYERWIDALAEQWANSTASPNGALDKDLWRVKRLQTGLASWATLRHATVLVNERNSAECGEGAFEFIELRPPRGYVEPDPQTFGKIAGLFDAAIALIRNSGSWLVGDVSWGDYESQQARESLRQGLLRRLGESAAKARLFQAIAAKETQGQALTSQEYEEILYFGRVAEHHFLVFNSLANKDLALSTPNPIPKIADVSDVRGGAPYLMVGVGRPIEWDHTVPFFGRHEIVKGAAYSFYEFSSSTPLNDADWMKKLPTQPHPSWIAPYISQKSLSCPARDPF